MALQSLSKKSYEPVIKSVTQHETLRESLPALGTSCARLRSAIPKVNAETLQFAETFSKSSQHEAIVKRRQDLLLLRNVERLVDIMELPTLLSTTMTSGPVNQSSALDLSSHVRRLRALYPDSELISSVADQADAAITQMVSELIISLGASGLKLVPAMRTASLLRRLLPDVLPPFPTRDAQEKALGVIFILRRLSTLTRTLEALDPLRQLAEEERRNAASKGGNNSSSSWSGGQHAERYLKRYIEIHREHSFGIISIFRSVFVSEDAKPSDPLQHMPDGLSTLPLHLSSMLLEVIERYLPGVSDQGSRDSILTQVLYCARSLGRLGGDFGILLSEIGGQASEDEWVQVAKRHRHLTSRLESVLGDYKVTSKGS